MAIPTTCERILADAPLPDVKPTDDARVAFLKDDAALIVARAKVSAGRRCIRHVRLQFRGAGKGKAS